MNKHPYLRAYLAGIAVPTAFLLLTMSSYTVLRYVVNVPVPIERVIVFPMALLPNAWGLWNVLYVKLQQKRKVSLGLFGVALLALVIVPLGYSVTQLLNFEIPQLVLKMLPVDLVVGMVIYYLIWKHFVGFLNAELGIG
jgi:hypothetical protein